MGNGLEVNVSVSAIAVFIQGLISFFSPCVLPLLPVYIGYLAGGTDTKDEDGNVIYKRSSVIINTLFFVIGISFAFFLLGMAATKLGGFFQSRRMLLIRVGGVLIALFGLFQLGLFESTSLNSEKRFRLPLHKLKVNPLVALLLGFTFSFAWTPCVGPMLTGVLVMAGTASTAVKGFLLIGLYTLGFVLPFMLTGIFTTSLLRFFKDHASVVRYTKKIGGIVMIIIGLVMFTGFMNDFSGYLSHDTKEVVADSKVSDEVKAGSKQTDDNNKTEDKQDVSDEKIPAAADSSDDDTKESKDNENERLMPPAPDLELVDQNGNLHKLSDYKGKTILLNFWATWCPACVSELDELQEAYINYNENQGDVIILGVLSPNQYMEKSAEEIEEFLNSKNITFPVLYDYDGGSFADYGIMSMPTTYMIDKKGNLYGYLTGAMTNAVIDDIISQTEGSVK